MGTMILNKDQHKRRKKYRVQPLNIFDVLNVSFMILLIIIMIFPFWIVFASSIVSAGEFFTNPVILWPQAPTFAAYRYIFNDDRILRSFMISAFITVVGTAYYLIITSSIAYALSKKYLPGRKFFLILITITMFFSGGLVPYFLLIRNLGLMNSIWVLILPGGIVIWDFIVMKSFFSQLPEELEESAKIDGASSFMIYARIIPPLSLPLLATFSLFSAVRIWNAWFDAMIFITNRSLQPFQLVLRQIVVDTDVPPELMNLMARGGVEGGTVFMEALQMAAVVVGILPILFLYPFLQKYFEKGIMIGSIKG